MRSCGPSARRLLSNHAALARSVHRSRSRSLAIAAGPHVCTVAALLNSASGADSSAVEVSGLVRSVRKQKRVAFVALSDGSALDPIQVVLRPEHAHNLSNGAAVRVSGQWLASSGGNQQKNELHAQSVDILGHHEASSYPIQKKYHSPEFLRTQPHLRCRLPTNALLLRLRSQVIASLTAFFAENEFIQTQPPVITSSDCEGAGEVFSVTVGHDTGPTELRSKHGGTAQELFFRSPKFLTVSAQLHLEALAQSVGKVWTLSPTFRAEKSDTPRHLSEFYMLEAEMCYVDDLDRVMSTVEQMLVHVTRLLMGSRVGDELLKARIATETGDEGDVEVTSSQLLDRWRGMISAPWPRITYKHAISELQNAANRGTTFEFGPTVGAALQAEHEKHLARTVGKGRPIFVTDYPKGVKAFYMAPSDPSKREATGDETVACFDLLVPDLCELAGGSMREHRLDELAAAMERRSISTTGPQGSDQSTLQWYLDLRRYGSAPHGGFGLGFDRLLSYLSGAANVRDVVSFPRWHGRCDC